jgi:hypothetical protein
VDHKGTLILSNMRLLWTCADPDALQGENGAHAVPLERIASVSKEGGGLGLGLLSSFKAVVHVQPVHQPARPARAASAPVSLSLTFPNKADREGAVAGITEACQAAKDAHQQWQRAQAMVAAAPEHTPADATSLPFGWERLQVIICSYRLYWHVEVTPRAWAWAGAADMV